MKPAVVVGTRHARDVSALQATREMIEQARERVDITNPYFTDDGIVDLVISAAQRGVKVRVLVAQESNSAIHSAALRHDYSRMLDAGIEIWEYPDAVVHGKVLVADGAVMFGTINLDAWALYRAYEVAALVDDRGRPTSSSAASSSPTSRSAGRRPRRPTAGRGSRTGPPTP